MTRPGCYWPLTEREIGEAIDRLAAMHQRARENVAGQGRDPGAARVLLEHWVREMSGRRIWPARFRQILVELERRGLVAIDGPFAVPVDPRRREVQRAGARA